MLTVTLCDRSRWHLAQEELELRGGLVVSQAVWRAGLERASMTPVPPCATAPYRARGSGRVPALVTAGWERRAFLGCMRGGAGVDSLLPEASRRRAFPGVGWLLPGRSGLGKLPRVQCPAIQHITSSLELSLAAVSPVSLLLSFPWKAASMSPSARRSGLRGQRSGEERLSDS